MVISKKLEKQRLQAQTHLRKIINVALPSEHANIVLHDLQIRCNSPNKTIQIEALQCWGKWINDHNLDEWEADSICHFAVKPLVTKKLHPSHKDSDVCKLKLNLMWLLLNNVQGKMTLKGPGHILDCFLQSCFTWLASIDHLENKVSVLILQLLISLFRKNTEIIECDNYIFVPIVIDIHIFKKFLNNYIEKFLDLFDNWKKIQDNTLIKNLWECFLDHCEVSHNAIVTPIWHRVFKVNQVFCSDNNNTIKERLSFLHVCVSNVKTVLLSSKHIGGQSCFMTPCEALLKKFVEIGISDSEELPSSEIFVLCEDISKVLSFKSTAICDYDLCIYLLDALDDFSLKSCFWGSWCGLVECFKKTLLAVDIKHFTKNQMKFYRKLRAPTVNFELDKFYLPENSIVKVYNNINTLNICCFCSIKTSTSLSSNSASEEIEISSESAPSTEKSVENQEFDATSPQETIENNSVTTHIIPFCSVTKTTPVNLSYNCGQFGSISSRTRTLNFTLNILNLNLDLIKNFCKAMDKNLIKFSISGFYNLELPMPFKCIKSTATNFVENLEVAPPSQSFDKCGINKLKKCTKRRSALSLDIVKIPTKRRNNDIILVEECKTYLGKSTIVNLASRTRSKRRAVEQETEKKSKEFPGRKKRKSFELLVQEIVKKNKLRKTEKNSCKKKLASLNNKGLGSKRKNRPVEQQKKEKTKNEKCLSVKRTKKTEKNEESNKKYSRKIATDGKLENFFRVIAPMKRKEKNFKNSKVEESNKKNFNKKAKGENNWKQTFLKTVVKESVEETKGETKSRKTFQKEKTPKIKLDLKTETNFTKCSKKRTKKQKRKKVKSTAGKISLENTGALQNEAIVEVAKQNKFVDSPNRVEDEHEITPEAPLDQVIDDREKKLNFNTVDGTEENLNDLETTFSSIEQTMSVDKHFSEEGISITNSKEIEKETELEEEKKTGGEAEVLDILETHEELFIRKKRVRTNDALDQTEVKKIKLDEDRIPPVRVTEKENVEILSKPKNVEFSSIKSTSAVDNSSPSPNPKFKRDSSPNRNSKSVMLSGSISSRALKMISLVPEYNRERYRPPWEISTRIETKTNNKVYPSVDRSSRVSKMLASLNKRMSHEPEASIDEDKLTRSFLETTPTSNLPQNLRMSKFNKRKKFIGFDDSKNETIIFQIDTPPSQMLAEREMLKEKYASPERVLVVIS